MNLFVSTTFHKDGDTLKGISQLSNAGIKHIELGSNHCHFDDYTFLDKYQHINFICHNYFPPAEKEFVVNIASNSGLDRAKSIDFLLRSIDFALKEKLDYTQFILAFAKPLSVQVNLLTHMILNLFLRNSIQTNIK